MADYLAKLIRAEGKDRAVIGHRLFVEEPPKPPWKAVDTRWRVGGEFDLMLEYRNVSRPKYQRLERAYAPFDVQHLHPLMSVSREQQ